VRLRRHASGSFLRVLLTLLCLLAVRQVRPAPRPGSPSGRPCAASLSVQTRTFLEEVRDRPEDFVANAGTEALPGKVAIAYLEQEQPSRLELDLFVPAAPATKLVYRRVAPSSSDDGDLFS
jgi:hypothetical protein